MSTPILISTSPLDDEDEVAVGANIVLTFDQAVQAGTGLIVIRHSAGGGVARTIPVTDTSQVSFSGNQLIINPTSDLAENHAYYITVTADAVRDLDNNFFAGISSSTAFNFTTAGSADTTGPVLTSTSPLDDATGVDVSTNIVLTFDEDIQLGASTGAIVIRHSVGGGIAQFIMVTDGSQVSISGNQLIINPISNLAENHAYSIAMNPDTVRDLANNPTSGFSSPTTFNFTTAGTADTTGPAITATSPADNATHVDVGTNIVISFTESITIQPFGFIRIRYSTGGAIAENIPVTDTSRVTFSGNELTINPTFDLLGDTGFYVTISNGVIYDLAGNPFSGITSPTALNFSTAPDPTAPLLVGTSPADDATGVAVGTNIVLTFDQPVQAGTGNIEIRHSVGGNIARTIPVTDAGQVSFAGNELIINPSTDLAENHAYYIIVTPNAVRDLDNKGFVGISSPSTVNFTTAGTADTTGPVVTSTSPADDATNVLASTNLVLTFNEPVKAGTGNIEIGSTIVIPVTDTSQIAFSGNQVTINPTYDFAPGYIYYVRFGSGAVLDQANNASAGISSSTQFNFTIAGTADTTPPQLVSSTPADEATDADAHANVILTFDEVVKPGSGTIWIHGYGGGTFNVTDTSQVTFSGNQVIINPANDLIEGQHYYITTSLDAIRDLAENSFSGFWTEEDLDFTTADPTPPTLVSATAASYFFTFIFSETVVRGSGDIEFRNALDGSLVRSFAITDESQVYFFNSLIQVTPSSPLPLGVNYYVAIAPGVILDQAGHSFAGISSPETFNFSTAPLDLIGTQGNDTLTGSNLNEVLNGISGVDTLIGGLGDDTYIIDNYEGGATSFLLYSPPLFSEHRHTVSSYLPAPNEVTFALYDATGDGLIDILRIGFENDSYVTLVVSTNEIGQNLTAG